MISAKLRAILLCAVIAAPVHAQTPSKSDQNAVRQIKARSVEFSRRYVANDIAGLIGMYAKTASIFPPGQQILRGTEALTKYWTHSPTLSVSEHRATPDSVVVSGKTAYDYGTYTITTKDGDAAARTSLGKYVIVWQRSTAGEWELLLDIWNASPAAK